MNNTIRQLDQEHFEEFFRMLKSMHEEEHETDGTTCENPTTDAHKKRLKNDLGEKYNVFMAVHDGKTAGFAQWYEGYAGLDAKLILYMENIYVKPEARGLGVAEKLFEKIKDEAKKRKCGRIDWVTLKSNTGSQKFYEKLGVKPDKHWLTYRYYL